jgi:hypothetical protein
MNSPGRSQRVLPKASLLDLLKTEFADARAADRLIVELLRHETYDRGFCLKLFKVANEAGRAAWEIRRLAILMLEHQILKLDPANSKEFDFLFSQLNLKPSPPSRSQIAGSVLKEGYTTTEVRGFTSEFRRKLERHNRVHEQIRGSRTSLNAVYEFVQLARHDCKLSLARYLFTPDEVVQRILGQVRVSNGVKDLDTLEPAFVANEVRHAVDLLPDYEARILKGLSRSSNIYWVAEATSSEFNSLVEYPLTTAVVVVKPPGSELEFEFKRAGRKDANPLNIVFARDGYTVPPSHRLDGGGMQWLLRYEAKTAAKLALVYRLVHGDNAPLAGYVARSSVSSVPTRRENTQLLTYLTEPHIFGREFRRMRVALGESVEAFTEEGDAILPHLRGELGLTAQFIGHVAPAQAILAGTSSFRLDKLARYLSSDGPKGYFTKGLGLPYTKQNAKRLADELLEEVLGVYRPPEVSYQSYQNYVDAALSVSSNRTRADQVYLSLVQQIGKLWGTLLAVRGCSRGESFVARNVGLKSFWSGGEWKVKIIFMDHDALVIPGPQTENFHAHGTLPSMAVDERYIWDKSNLKRFATSEVGYLQSIYRPAWRVCAQGEALGLRALKDAYRKTQNELVTNPQMERLFNRVFIERLLDWDTLVSGYLKKNSSSEAWKKKMRKMMAAKGYKRRAFDAYMEITEKNKDFIKRYAFLFED